MKRIVDGVTYNTDTSSMLAQHEWEDEDQFTHTVRQFGIDTLYQTLGGAFFVHKEKTVNEWDPNEREHRQRVRHEFVPLSPEDAHKWMLEGDVEVTNNPFDDPPEATAEAEPGATIYIRVPASLKRRVDLAAKGLKVSGNIWAMRCVERCLEKDDTFKWWDWIEEAFNVDDRTPAMFATMAWVIAHASSDGKAFGFDSSTHATIAEEVGSTKPAVQAALRLLSSGGFLIKDGAERNGVQPMRASLPSIH